MLVLEDDLTALTGGVWEAFLGMACEPDHVQAPCPGPFFTSCVNISGGWDGSVSLVIPKPLARAAAAAMFGMTDDELGDDEVVDAVGELANIIGGNVKGMIDDPCTLSLPMVAVGTDYQVSVPGTALVQSVSLLSEGLPFQVAVHRRTS